MGCGGSKPEEAVGGDAKPEDKPGETKEAEKVEEDGPLTKNEIESRILGMDKPETFELGISGFVLRYGVLSQRGYYPEDLFKANQDRYLIKQQIGGKKDAFFMGVFDGHGQEGDSCAEFVRKRAVPLLESLMNKDSFKYDFKQAVLETWRAIDDEMHEQEDFSDTYSGTTSISAIFRGKEMYVSNIGDSRAIIGERQGKRIVAKALSIDQTPYRKDERDRIKAAGGVIMTCAPASPPVGCPHHARDAAPRPPSPEPLCAVGRASPSPSSPPAAAARAPSSPSSAHRPGSALS